MAFGPGHRVLAAPGAGRSSRKSWPSSTTISITLSEVRAQHEVMIQTAEAQLQGEEYEKQYTRLKGELVNNMITDLLLLQAARERQLNVQEQVKLSIRRP